MPPSFAFVSAGQLFASIEGAPPREIDSQFAREMRERQGKSQRRHGWKAESDELVNGMPGAGVWGKQGLANARPVTAECTALTRGAAPNAVTFALQVGDVGGVFDTELDAGAERRLMHRANLRIEEMERHPRTGALAYAQHAGAGTIHLAKETR